MELFIRSSFKFVDLHDLPLLCGVLSSCAIYLVQWPSNLWCSSGDDITWEDPKASLWPWPFGWQSLARRSESGVNWDFCRASETCKFTEWHLNNHMYFCDKGRNVNWTSCPPAKIWKIYGIVMQASSSNLVFAVCFNMSLHVCLPLGLEKFHG